MGVFHGLFLAIFLWVYTKGSHLANKLLSTLLVVLSFRVGKSVFLEFTEIDVKLIFIGLSAIMAIGPLYYLFTLSCVNKLFQLKWKHAIHFIPATIGLAFGLIINEGIFRTSPKLVLVFIFSSYYLHLLIYLMVSYQYTSKQRKAGLNQDVFELLRLLFYGLLIIWIAYVLNLFDEFIPYVIGPILYSIVA